jgi:hypothetical protein
MTTLSGLSTAHSGLASPTSVLRSAQDDPVSSVGADPLNGSSDLACGPRLPLGPPRPRPWPPKPSVPTLRRPSGSDTTIAGRVASRRTSVPARDSARIARTRSPGAHGPDIRAGPPTRSRPLARRTERRTGTPAELRMTPGIGHVVLEDAQHDHRPRVEDRQAICMGISSAATRRPPSATLS